MAHLLIFQSISLYSILQVTNLTGYDCVRHIHPKADAAEDT